MDTDLYYYLSKIPDVDKLHRHPRAATVAYGGISEDLPDEVLHKFPPYPVADGSPEDHVFEVAVLSIALHQAFSRDLGLAVLPQALRAPGPERADFS
jgi:hypothetical protein